MRDYTIVTDSTCDLSPEMIERYNLKIATLSVLLDGKVYKNYPDEREITNKELYAAMRSKKLPTTSAVNPEDFEKIFRPELEAGRDILYVGFSSAMSCTYNSGCTGCCNIDDFWIIAIIGFFYRMTKFISTSINSV